MVYSIKGSGSPQGKKGGGGESVHSNRGEGMNMKCCNCTYRVIEGDIMLLEEGYSHIMAPCGRVAGPSEEHCVE